MKKRIENIQKKIQFSQGEGKLSLLHKSRILLRSEAVQATQFEASFQSQTDIPQGLVRFVKTLNNQLKSIYETTRY